MATSQQQLEMARRAIQEGRKEHAANVLIVLLASEPQHVEAWWLLAHATNSVDIQRRALQNVLQLRPGDPQALEMLESVNVREAMMRLKHDTNEMRPARSAVPSPTPAQTNGLEPRYAELRRRSASPPRPKKRRVRWFPIALAGALVFLIAGCALLAFAALNGLRIVEDAMAEFSPSLPFASAARQPTQSPLGDVNALGSIAYQQWRSGTLQNPSERHAYVFRAAANDFVAVEVSALDSSLDPAVALYGPDGVLIAGNTDIAIGNSNAGLALTLPAAGDYTILVSSQGAAGRYQLTLQH